jgi:hypothetical protein
MISLPAAKALSAMLWAPATAAETATAELLRKPRRVVLRLLSESFLLVIFSPP